MVDIGTRGEIRLPLDCCDKPLPVDLLLKFVPHAEDKRFRHKLEEEAVPPHKRVYCPEASCSVFLRKASKHADWRKPITCWRCGSLVCMVCKHVGHESDDCRKNISASRTKKLVAKNKWQTCPWCGAIVERIEGCPQMICRCRRKFCYLCGAKGHCDTVHKNPVSV